MSIDKLERSNQRLDAAAADTGAGADEPRQSDTASRLANRQYAEELTARFQAYVDWAIGHWPLDATPLDRATFDRSRQDLAAVCRQAGAPVDEADPGVPGGAQFVPVTPMPWP